MKSGEILLSFFTAVFFLLRRLTAFAAVRAVGGIAGGVAGEGEELSAGLALPCDVPQRTLALLHFLFFVDLLPAVLAEGGDKAPGGINGEGFPALFAGLFLLLRFRGGRFFFRHVLTKKTADLFQQFHGIFPFSGFSLSRL